MNQVVSQNFDASSLEFKEEAQAGLNPGEDTTNGQAGNELGQELGNEGDEKESVRRSQSSTPLFLRDGPEGNKGNAQDEKDEMGE